MRPSFEPILPSVRPDLIAAAEHAAVVHDDAVEHLRTWATGIEGVPCEVVAWAWVFDEAIERILLVDHKSFKSWRAPGGRAAPDESTIDAARRELREETGARARLLFDRPALVDAHPSETDDGRPNRSFGFAHVFLADPDQELIAEHGQPAAWFRLDDPPARRSERHWQRMLDGAELARRGR